MAAGNWTLTNQAKLNLLNGTFDLDATSTWYIALLGSGATLSATSTSWASVSSNEVSNAGYTANGTLVTISLSGTSTVTADCGDVNWTASGASLTAKYAVLYKTGGDILCYCELESGSTVTVTAGNTLTVTVTNLFSLT